LVKDGWQKLGVLKQGSAAQLSFFFFLGVVPDLRLRAGLFLLALA
jgi:hypothetical protein